MLDSRADARFFPIPRFLLVGQRTTRFALLVDKVDDPMRGEVRGNVRDNRTTRVSTIAVQARAAVREPDQFWQHDPVGTFAGVTR